MRIKAAEAVEINEISAIYRWLNPSIDSGKGVVLIGRENELEQYSFSKLSSFHNCKHAYYLTYIKGEKGINNASALYGSYMHSLLERYAKGELAVYELYGEYKDKFSENVNMDFPPNKYADLAESYYNDGLNYLANFEGWDNYKILGIESEFLESVDGDWNLKGFIDLVLEDKNGDIIIVDHKSKQKFSGVKERREYARQLYLYSLHVRNLYGKFPKRLVFNQFRKQRIVKIDFDEDDYGEAQSWAKNTVKEIRNCQDYPMAFDSFMCSYLCNHREYCEKRGAGL